MNDSNIAIYVTAFMIGWTVVPPVVWGIYAFATRNSPPKVYGNEH